MFCVKNTVERFLYNINNKKHKTIEAESRLKYFTHPDINNKISGPHFLKPNNNLIYIYISKSWSVVFIVATLQLSHIIAMSQSFYFPFFLVSTPYILFNQSHSLSQLIIFPSNKRLMFILLMTFLLNPNSLKFNNQSFSLSLTYHLLIKKTTSFPHQNIQLPPFEFKTHWFNFFIYRFWITYFPPH